MDRSEVVQQLTTEMESSFKDKGLDEQLSTLVDKALEMNNDQVRGALLAMKSPLVKPTGKINIQGKFVPAEKIHKQIKFRSDEIYQGNITMGMWRRVVEVEALNREIADIDISKLLSVIATRVTEEHEPEQETEEEEVILAKDDAEPKLDRPREGFTAKNAPNSLRKKVVSLRKNGMAFYQIEKELGLREVRGMTAHRIYSREVGKKAG